MLLILLLTFLSVIITKERQPVVIVPGLGGNQLFATLKEKKSDHWYCPSNHDEFQIWLQLTKMLPISIDCFIEDMKRVYNSEMKKYVDKPGVSIYPKDWGSVETFRYIDPGFKYKGSLYFESIVKLLESKGYQDKKDMFGAPYDFRDGPIDNPFKQALISLIEEAYHSNQNKKVVIISHSLGCKWMVEIMKMVDKKWKDQYIDRWIAFSPVYGGSVKALRSVLSGSDEGIPYVDKLDIQPILASWECFYWILPHHDLFERERILVKAIGQDWKQKSLGKLLKRRVKQPAVDLYEKQKFLFNVDPEIPHYPIYALETDTEIELTYPDECSHMLLKFENFDCQPYSEYGSGDGTVEKISLEAGNHWKDTVLVDGHIQNKETHNSVLVTQKSLDLISQIMELEKL